MIFRVWRCSFVGLALMLVTVAAEGDLSAQCATCPTPTVAYQPVVAQPTVAYRPYTGWYPGKWLDQWRLRRAGVASTAPVYSAAYAPTYTAAYAPTYTAAYAPVNYTASYTPTYTAAYRPYVTSYAPLSVPIASTCNTCVQTVARPVLMRPVVTASGCDACSCSPCNCVASCDPCSTGVSQAAYAEPACSSCAASAAAPVDRSFGPNVGPQTPRPSLTPQPAPIDSRYESRRPIDGSGSREGQIGDPALEVDPLKGMDDAGGGTESDSSTYYPRLIIPGDRTARTHKSRQPTVDVWTAVYRRPASQTRGVRPASNRQPARVQAESSRTQAEIDAEGWSAVAPR